MEKELKNTLNMLGIAPGEQEKWLELFRTLNDKGKNEMVEMFQKQVDQKARETRRSLEH
jgi:truncated hemoglobin YjbI